MLVTPPELVVLDAVHFVESMPEPPVSVQFQLIVTGPLFQPWFGVGDNVGAAVGPVVSIRTVTVGLPPVLPTRSVQLVP